jgi:N-acetylglucosaminyl-diphospho-decaprenol L-rhamnosyltransferase
VNVAGVVVTHGPSPVESRCLAAIGPQVDELVVIANLPGEAPELPAHGRLIQSPSPRGFAANANTGIAATTAALVLLANPDTVPAPDAVGILAAFAEKPRVGIVGPELRYPDGRWQPSRRRFPTVTGTLVRRTPLRFLMHPFDRQRSHYLLDERPSHPTPADWLLGAFLLLRREMLDELGGLDEGYRLYGEDIDLAYRAERAGWERWLVPAAVVEHDYAAVIDRRFLTRRTLWHLRSMARFVRKHPERLRAL